MAAFISNPYRGAIDPDTAEGKKMISKMTAGLEDEDKFDMKQENIIEFKDNLEEAVNTYCYGSVVCAIPINYDNAGAVVTTGNLLTEPHLVPLESVMVLAQQVWGNADGDFRIDSDGTAETDPIVLDQRMRSSLFGMWLKNSLTKDEKKKLMLHKSNFRHYYTGINTNAYEDDGSTIVRIIWDKCDPTTKSGVNALKSELLNFTLDDFKQDVPDMLDDMQIKYNRIIQTGGQDDDFMLKVFNAMETSEDEDFLDFVKKKRDLWEEDELQDDVDALIRACTKKHNNLAKSKTKKKNAKPRQEDQESKFMALLTQMLPILSNAHATNGNGNFNGNGNNRGYNNNTDNPFSRVEPYRMEFVGNTIERHGRTLHWCPKHNDGKGMHVTHKPEDHDEWQRKKNAFRKGAASGKGSQPDIAGGGGGTQGQSAQKLELSNSMKAALTTGDLSALTTFLQNQSKE